jgi:hypothetical protein
MCFYQRVKKFSRQDAIPSVAPGVGTKTPESTRAIVARKIAPGQDELR